MTQVGINGEIWLEPSGNPSGSALGISLVLRLYFTVYPSSRHNTDTVSKSMKGPGIRESISSVVIIGNTGH